MPRKLQEYFLKLRDLDTCDSRVKWTFREYGLFPDSENGSEMMKISELTVEQMIQESELLPCQWIELRHDGQKLILRLSREASLRPSGDEWSFFSLLFEVFHIIIDTMSRAYALNHLNTR